MKKADRRRGVRILGALVSLRIPRVFPPAAGRRGLSLPNLLAALTACAVLLAVSRMVVASGTVTIYVDDNSTCTSGCGSLASPWKTIAAALSDANTQISGAQATDAIIQVAGGNYPERFTVFPNCHVICESPATTTINGAGFNRSTVIFSSGGTGRLPTDFSIDGCTITGGMGEVRGGGLYLSGGGVFAFGDAVITNNLITANTPSGTPSTWFGGGVYVATGQVFITGNTISKNILNPPALSGQDESHAEGGGIYVLGPPASSLATIEANLIADNSAQGEAGTGGGVWVYANPGTVIRRNMFIGNRALDEGGGIEIWSGDLTFSDNLVYGNSCTVYGGGVNLYQTSAVIINNTVFGNAATGTSTPSGYNFGSYGGGIVVNTLQTQTPPTVTLSNNILFRNTVTSVGTGAGLWTERTTPFLYSNDYFGNIKFPSTAEEITGDYTTAGIVGQNGNVSVDAQFVNAPLLTDYTTAAGTTTTVIVPVAARFAVNQKIEYNDDGVSRTITAINTSTRALTFTPALAAASQASKMVTNWGASTATAEDFRLQPASPLVDAGTNAGVSAIDLDGNPRVSDGDNDGIAVVDLGPWEVSPPDCDGDGVPNDHDCAPCVASVQTPPGTVGDTLREASGSPMQVTWLRIPQANAYNVYRGTISGAFVFNQTCYEAASPDRVAVDSDMPAVNTCYYYLITGVNSCSEGSLGMTDPGNAGPPAERPNTAPCAASSADSDGDGIINLDDNCGAVANPAQADQDVDRVGDVCDNCPAAPNPDQSDWNQDGIGNHCQDVDGDSYLGSVDCNDQVASIHPGAVEVCNGADDDCDNAVDEDMGTLTCGVGACQVTVNACVNGSPGVCTPGTPHAETCNNVDDDCNGQVDDGLLPITCGLGACQVTVAACVNGTPGTCTPGTPQTETCNGIDDDCDGTVDNNLPDNDLDGTPDCYDPDDDNDTVPDVDDCAPFLASVSAAPGVVGDSLLAPVGAPGGSFAFLPVAQAHVFNVYRGTVGATVPGNYLPSLTCLFAERPSPDFIDGTDVPVGQILYYIVTGTNRCGEGGPGSSSDGTPRPQPPACASPGLDGDLDGVPDRDDVCPLVADPGQADADHDGRGDICDNCPNTPNPDQADSDGNGVGDACQP